MLPTPSLDTPAAAGANCPSESQFAASASATGAGTSLWLMSAEFDCALLAARRRNDLNACHDLYHALAVALVLRGPVH